jgi:hypothetical protein
MTPFRDHWIVWVVLQLITLYNFFPQLINLIVSKDISKRITRKFLNDLKDCSFEKVEEKTPELDSLFRKLLGLSQLPMKIGWVLENIVNMISGGMAIWYISGNWILLVLSASISSAILDECVNSRKISRIIIKDMRQINKEMNRHIELIPLWNGTGSLNMEKSFLEVVHNDRSLEQKFNDFWIRKNILPDIAAFCVSVYIFSNIQGVISDSSMLLLALTNLGFFVHSTKCLIRNINQIRIDISKLGDYKEEIKKLGEKSRLNIVNEIPNAVTQLTGISGRGKTRLIRRIVECIGLEIVYLSQSDNVNFNDMTPGEAVQYLQEYQDDKLAKKCLDIAGLNKEIDIKLSRPCGGEIQKIRIARTMFSYFSHPTRNIIIMDEPDNNINSGVELDDSYETSQNGFKQIMEAIFVNLRPGTKLIFTTHKGFALVNSLIIHHKTVEELSELIFG